MTFSHVRDFTWRGTKDRDEAWARDVTFDLNAIKDVWYITDHFSKQKGLRTPCSPSNSSTGKP